MAINKNFVVKNGLEVNSSLIVADTDATASSPFGGVGIGTTAAPHTLHVNGGIGVTHLLVTGIATFNSNVAVGGAFTATGIGSFSSDVVIDGTLTVGGEQVTTLGDDIETRNLKVSGFSTFVGFSTFQDQVFFQDGLTVTGVGTFSADIDVDGHTELDNVSVSGILTAANTTDSSSKDTGSLIVEGGVGIEKQLFVGAGASVGSGLTVSGDVSIADKIIHSGDTDTAIRFSEADTITAETGGSERLRIVADGHVGIGTTNPAIAADTNNTAILNVGIITANNIFATSISGSAQIGVGSEHTFIGAGITQINFASTNGTAIAVDIPPATATGIATVTITPGVSLGLAIALGG